MNRQTTLLLPLAIGVLSSCIGPKKNAHLTLVKERRHLNSPLPLPLLSTPPNRPTPATLSFAELRQLASDPTPQTAVAAKIDRLFSTASISNTAWSRRSQFSFANNPTLGDFIRVASWNIEKSLFARDAAAALKSEDAFKRLLKPEVLQDPERLAEALRQRERLINADILLLQEMDVGMPRSGYIDATQEIAKALGMNYSYAPQQLEIDRVPLGIDPGSAKPDAARYKGLFGIAVLSRFPITHATAFQLKNQPYDWYHSELSQPDSVEKIRRYGAKLLLHTRIEREMKIGGRIFYRVDLHVPGLPGNTLTIIHNHLEIKTTTRGREQQLKEILEYIRSIPHPVIMAGDHNSAVADISPTSLLRITQRTVQDTQTWLSVATNVIGTQTGISLARSALNATRNLHNPLAIHIPLLLPNRARKLFHLIEKFEFDDGGQFDPRGDKQRSINGSNSKFANSNESYFMGLRPTFRVPRPIGPIGRTRLDWIFVKQPAEWKDSYRLAPHFGETLETFDTALATPLSDHRPIVADLPLNEPPLSLPTASASPP
jgi:endonuclease/exonuclease/phosphatase family metal-dependent hydrolase